MNQMNPNDNRRWFSEFDRTHNSNVVEHLFCEDHSLHWKALIRECTNLVCKELVQLHSNEPFLQRIRSQLRFWPALSCPIMPHAHKNVYLGDLDQQILTDDLAFKKQVNVLRALGRSIVFHHEIDVQYPEVPKVIDNLPELSHMEWRRDSVEFNPIVNIHFQDLGERLLPKCLNSAVIRDNSEIPNNSLFFASICKQPLSHLSISLARSFAPHQREVIQRFFASQTFESLEIYENDSALGYSRNNATAEVSVSLENINCRSLTLTCSNQQLASLSKNKALGNVGRISLKTLSIDKFAALENIVRSADEAEFDLAFSRSFQSDSRNESDQCLRKIAGLDALFERLRSLSVASLSSPATLCFLSKFRKLKCLKIGFTNDFQLSLFNSEVYELIQGLELEELHLQFIGENGIAVNFEFEKLPDFDSLFAALHTLTVDSSKISATKNQVFPQIEASGFSLGYNCRRLLNRGLQCVRPESLRRLSIFQRGLSDSRESMLDFGQYLSHCQMLQEFALSNRSANAKELTSVLLQPTLKKCQSLSISVSPSQLHETQLLLNVEPWPRLQSLFMEGTRLWTANPKFPALIETLSRV